MDRRAGVGLSGGLMFLFTGALFSVIGIVLLVAGWSSDPVLAGAVSFLFLGLGGVVALIGLAETVSEIGRRRDDAPPSIERDGAGRYRFKRPASRVVVDLLGPPIGALLFLGFAVGLASGALPFEYSDPLTALFGRIIGPLVFGFFGLLMALSSVNGLRRGLRRTLLEVGADGIWTPESGRLPWSEVLAVRREFPAGASERPAPGSQARRPRLGILPLDPEVARGDPVQRASAAMLGGLFGLVQGASRAPVPSLDDVAPFGVYEWELDTPLDEVVARVAEFFPMTGMETTGPRIDFGTGEVEGNRSGALPPLAAEPHAASPLGATPAPTPDAAPPLGATPAPTPDAAPPLGATPAPTPDAAPPFGAKFARPSGRGQVVLREAWRVAMFTLFPLVSLAVILVILVAMGDVPLLVYPFVAAIPLLFVALGLPALLAVPSRFSHALGDPQMLEVAPEGLWLRDTGLLPWRAIDEIRVESRGLMGRFETTESWRLGVVPRETELAARRGRALRWRDAYLAWASRLPGRPIKQVPAPFGVEEDMLAVPLDEVIEAVRRYHPVVPYAEA